MLNLTISDLFSSESSKGTQFGVKGGREKRKRKRRGILQLVVWFGLPARMGSVCEGRIACSLPPALMITLSVVRETTRAVEH